MYINDLEWKKRTQIALLLKIDEDERRPCTRLYRCRRIRWFLLLLEEKPFG